MEKFIFCTVCEVSEIRMPADKCEKAGHANKELQFYDGHFLRTFPWAFENWLLYCGSDTAEYLSVFSSNAGKYGAE